MSPKMTMTLEKRKLINGFDVVRLFNERHKGQRNKIAGKKLMDQTIAESIEYKMVEKMESKWFVT